MNFQRSILSKYSFRGDHVSLTTIVDNCSLIGLGWKDKTIKTFISSCGTTLPGQPHLKHRYTKDGDLTTSKVQRPQLVSQYFSAACKIDVHNHLRQGLLSIEEAWITQTWWHRLAATFFGIIVTDALLAYNYEHSTSTMTVHEFANDLASSLIFNHFDGHVPEQSQRRRQSSESITEPSSNPVDPFISHPVRSLVLLPAYQSKKGSKEGARCKCSVFAAHGKRRNAHYYCEACSDISKGSFVLICGHQSERGTACHTIHCRNAPKVH